MNRTTRRRLEKTMGKQHADNLADKIFQFNKLPGSCSACEKEFDKADKTMVQSWKVVVRQETVRIFCPDCINKTQEAIDECPQIIESSTTENS
jgi:hypothetical protein